MQISAGGIHAERPSRAAVALPCRETECMTKQIADRRLAPFVCVRARVEEDPGGPSIRAERVRLRGPVEVSQRSGERVKVMFRAVVIPVNGGQRLERGLGTRRRHPATRRTTSAVTLSRLPALERGVHERCAAACDVGVTRQDSGSSPVEHAVQAVAAEQQHVARRRAAARCRWTSTCSRAPSTLVSTFRIGWCEICSALMSGSWARTRGRPRVVFGQLLQRAVGKQVQAAVADVADRDFDVVDEQADDRGAHAGVVVAALRRPGRSGGWRDGWRCAAGCRRTTATRRCRKGQVKSMSLAERRMKAAIASIARREATSPARWPPMPSATAKSLSCPRRTTKRSSLVLRTGPAIRSRRTAWITMPPPAPRLNRSSAAQAVRSSCCGVPSLKSRTSASKAIENLGGRLVEMRRARTLRSGPPRTCRPPRSSTR